MRTMSATGIIFEDGRSSTDSLPKAENQRDGLSPCLDTSAPHRSVRGFSALMPDCMGPISETHCESFISGFLRITLLVLSDDRGPSGAYGRIVWPAELGGISCPTH
jgi:hypothetical protein